METLSLALWRERELLEELHYRLEVEQLVLASGRGRWLSRATDDVQRTLEDVRAAGLLRAIAADEAAASCGLAPEPSLRALADLAPEPWGAILRDHRTALLAATRAIATLADANRALLSAGYQAARETVTVLGSPDSYAADGRAVASASTSRILDRSL